jgi:hypothetical protein
MSWACPIAATILAGRLLEDLVAVARAILLLCSQP